MKIEPLEIGSPYGSGAYERAYLNDNPTYLVDRYIRLRDKVDEIIELLNNTPTK